MCAGLLPLRQAFAEVVLDPGGGPVAILGVLGEKLEDDAGDGRGRPSGPVYSVGRVVRAMWLWIQSMGSVAVKGRRR